MTLYPGIPRAEYEGLPGINWSCLKVGIGRTGVHIETALAGVSERADSAAMKFGRALHQAILEPDIFATAWTIKTGVKTTTVPDMLTESEHANIVAMVAKFRGLGLQIDNTEMAMTWQRGGYDCKGSVDAMTTNGILIDLKTTEDASPKAMAQTAWKYHYHTQLAWYKQGLLANDVPVTECIIVAMEKSPPYSIGCYTIGKYAMQRGEAMIAHLLGLYRDRTIADYPLSELITPTWASEPE